MLLVDINISGFVPAPGAVTVQNVRVIATDASGNVAFDDRGTVMQDNPNVSALARLNPGEYTFTAQAYDEHGLPHGPVLTVGPVTITEDTSALPSFVPTGFQVSF